MNIKHIAWLLLLSIFWASLFIFIKIGDASIDPYTLMAGRAITSTIFMFAVLYILKKPFLEHVKNIRLQLVCFTSSILIAYMWITVAVSETVISAGMASFLLTTLVIFSWLIATFITHEKPFYRLNLLGIIVAVIGLLVLLGLRNIFYGHYNALFALFYVSGIACFCTAAALNKHKAPKIDPFVMTTFSLFYVMLILIVCSAILGHPSHENYTWPAILSLLGTGIICSGAGYLIFFWLVKHAGQVFASLNAYLVPAFGALMGFLFLDEHFFWTQLLGLFIIFVGMYLAGASRKKQKC